MCISDRTPKRLQFTQEVAEETLNRSAVVLDLFQPISDKVKEWNDNMDNEMYSTTAFERSVVFAGNAGML